MSAPSSFSAALRERCGAAAAPGEGWGFLADLMCGRGTRDDYIALVAQHAFVYEALEVAAERMRRDPVAATFLLDRPSRLPAIEADLGFLVGPRWREALTALPATARYVQRIREVGATWAGGFVAHHFTRVLGDLSGGPSIGRLLQRRYGFDTNGIGFFLSSDIADPRAFRDVYREQLDAAPWDEAERERVTAEVLVAYRCNSELFDDLARTRASRAVA
ncbi:heme oxygenase (biliverdin-producing) [Microbacterium sp. NPDC091313]